jgi:metal-dependent amidase/aminoacylase/carboxypeptidase family protein
MAENFQLAPSDVERLIRDRRDFHAHPELGYNEQRTAAAVAEEAGEANFVEWFGELIEKAEKLRGAVPR